jgi:hypothetical protein
MKALMITACALLLAGCTPSAMILSTARNEYDILNRYSSRQNVEKYLGAALEEETISPPVPLAGFKFPQFAKAPNSRFASHLIFYTPDYPPSEKESQIIATRCRYQMRGKIVPHGYAGDANAVTMMSFGLGEILMLPMAISEVRPDASIVNGFEVWYSTKGTVLAYHWTWRSEKEPSTQAQPRS